MMTERLISPQVPLDPEKRPSQWPVIGRKVGQPYFPKTREAAKVGIIGDQQLIIPQPPMERRPINPQTRREITIASSTVLHWIGAGFAPESSTDLDRTASVLSRVSPGSCCLPKRQWAQISAKTNTRCLLPERVDRRWRAPTARALSTWHSLPRRCHCIPRSTGPTRQSQKYQSDARVLNFIFTGSFVAYDFAEPLKRVRD